MSIFRKLLNAPISEKVIDDIDTVLYGYKTDTLAERRAFLRTVIRMYLRSMAKNERGEGTTKKL